MFIQLKFSSQNDGLYFLMVHRIWSLKDLCYTLSFPLLGDSILDTVSFNILDYNPSIIFARA